MASSIGSGCGSAGTTGGTIFFSFAAQLRSTLLKHPINTMCDVLIFVQTAKTTKVCQQIAGRIRGNGTGEVSRECVPFQICVQTWEKRSEVLEGLYEIPVRIEYSYLEGKSTRKCMRCTGEARVVRTECHLDHIEQSFIYLAILYDRFCCVSHRHADRTFVVCGGDNKISLIYQRIRCEFVIVYESSPRGLYDSYSLARLARSCCGTVDTSSIRWWSKPSSECWRGSLP